MPLQKIKTKKTLDTKVFAMLQQSLAMKNTIYFQYSGRSCANGIYRVEVFRSLILDGRFHHHHTRSLSNPKSANV